MSKPRPFGHYFILEKIAQGGMAEIFKGLTYDFSGLKKFIVIKRILPHIAANREFIHMLVDEAKIAVRLNHGNIAQTFDLGKVAEDYFIVMEYVEGRTLSQVFKKSVALKDPIPIPMASFIVSEICNGLDYIHRRKDEHGESLGIVHCDISPQNIIIGPSGTVKIVDFGVAKAASKLSERDRGVLKGKFAYMSPEQTEGTFVDPRSDLFSTGVVLWEVLTGRRLFKKKTNGETIEAVNTMTVYPPSAYRNEIPSELDEIVMKALERDPNKRYQNAHDLSLELTKFNLKHFPEFKPVEIGQVLGRLFEDEDNTGDLFNEKTQHEEATHLDPDRVPPYWEEEDKTPSEDTAIVDPQELDFQSIFEDIEIEEVSEVTKSVAWTKPGQGHGEDELEPTGDLVEPARESTSVEGMHPKPMSASLRWSLMALGFVLLLGGLFGLARLLKKSQEIPPAAVHGPVITVESEPSGAAVYIDGQMTGMTTPASLQVHKLHFPLLLGLSKGGAPHWTHALETAPAKDMEILADLNAPWGTLDLLSRPAGAEVFLGERLLGKTPLLASRVPAGAELKVRFQMPGYRPSEETLTLKEGQNRKIETVLQKSPPR